MSILVNILSDGRIEYTTEGRQILYRYRYKLISIYVNIVHVITCMFIYIPMSKATCKMNFKVQFILVVNKIDFILFAANDHLVDHIHLYLPCMSFYSNVYIQYR